MKYTIKKYPDGGQYVTIDDISKNTFTYFINDYADLFMLKSIKDAWDNLTNKALLEVTIPCMFQQQHDRRFANNESFELKIVCDFINNCKFSKVNIFHPHNESAIAMGIDNVNFISITDNFYDTLFYNVINETNKPMLFSTDAGSFKWVNKLGEKYNLDVYSASKNRIHGSGSLIQTIDCTNFNNRDIWVCDDLCVYGGTFVGLGNMLKERNCGDLYLIVSHITVKTPNKQLEKLYKNIYTANSKNYNYDLTNLNIIPIF